MTDYLKRFEAFSNALSKNIPHIIKYKDSSLLMKILGYVLFFNPRFMTKFVTTIGNTVYFPNKDYIASAQNAGIIGILAHEVKHIKDHEKTGSIISILGYMFPQILVPLALLGLFINWYVAVIALVILLLPWPAPGRKNLELNGYIMSLFFGNEIMKEDGFNAEERTKKLLEAVEVYNKYFTSFDYYMMWPFGVKKELSEAVEKIISGEIMKEDVIYGEVVSALNDSK